MAQVDTGLGWSAKDTWLKFAQDTVIGEIGGFATSLDSTQPLPQISDPNEVFTKGKLIANRQNGFMLYYAACSIGTEGIVFISSEQNSYVQFFSPNHDFKFYIGTLRSGSVREVGAYTGTSYSPNYQVYGNIGTTPIYYSPGWAIYINESEVINIPQVTKQVMFNSLSLDIAPVIKSSDGYAVACVAKWKTDNNVLFTTPVLISSVSENTDMACSDSSYSLAKLNVRMDGIQFYMSFFDITDQSIQTVCEVADLSMFKLDLNQVFNLIAQSGMANIQVTETIDPFKDFGYTGEDAGEINPDPQDDDIEVDDLPTKSFASAGFCRIYNPDISDLNDLASYMWTDQSFLQTVINHLKQIIENPIEAIISLSMVPVQPQVGPSKVPVNVMFINTGVSMRPVTSQFVSVDCGTTVLQEVYGGALDYNPYTSVQIYLPYIGTVQLDTDEVMAKTLHLTYHIDVVTGICCAEIEVNNKLLYQFSGHCSVSQPITSADFSSYLNAAIAAAKIVVGVASGSSSVTATAAAAQTPPEVSGSKPAPQSTALVPASGGGSIGPHLGSPGSHSSHNWTDFSDIVPPESSSGIAWGELAKPGNANTVASVMSAKRAVQHSGGFSGNSGYLAKRRPYLIVVRPRIANPENYAQHFGRTSMEYLNLGSCTGYTKVQSVHLSGFDATNPELSEISSLLKGGVLM